MSVQISTLAQRVTLDTSEQASHDTQEYFINMGPQHPATHGVLRLMLRLDGETIKEVIPVLGYIHRGIEKIGESQTYRQFVHLTDRMDYLSAMMNNWAVAMAVEQATQTELNDRIQFIRTLMAELERLQSHLLWWGVLGMDLGAFTPFLYGFRDRELLTDVFEETVGCRLTMNYIQPGGVMTDIHPHFVARVKSAIAEIQSKLDEYDTLLSNNVILRERTYNIGILKESDAVALGVTGPPLRASGVALDLRKTDPYGAYGKLTFSIPVGATGDCWDRYWVRVSEMRQSISMIEQLIDNIPEGKTMLMKPAKKIVLPEGIWTSQIETARGILGVVIASDGKSESPQRIHLRSPNFNNLWAIDCMSRGGRIGDLVANVSSLDLVIPDIDR